MTIKYLKFRIDIKNNQFWAISPQSGKETEITNRWSDKWGSMGFTIWRADDWVKSGRTTFVNCHIRQADNWSNYNKQNSKEEPVLEAFYKHYDPQTEQFLYWKKYYNLGKDFWTNPAKSEVIIEFKEEDRVEQNRNTKKWEFINKGKKDIFEDFER